MFGINGINDIPNPSKPKAMDVSLAYIPKSTFKNADLKTTCRFVTLLPIAVDNPLPILGPTQHQDSQGYYQGWSNLLSLWSLSLIQSSVLR